MKDSNIKWGFASSSLLVLALIVSYHWFRDLIARTVDGTSSAAPLRFLPMTGEALAALVLLLVTVFFLVSFREIKSFFFSIKAGVVLVLFALGGCLVGVLIPQLDDQEDPSTKVDLASATIVDPEQFFPEIEHYSGNLDLIDLDGQTQGVRLSASPAFVRGGDASVFFDVPLQVARRSPRGSGYIFSIDYAVGRRGGKFRVELWDRHQGGPAHLHNADFATVRNYAQIHDGEVIPEEPDKGFAHGQWFLKRQVRISQRLIPLERSNYVLRFILEPSDKRRVEDAQLPLELVVGRIRAEEFKHYEQYRKFAEAEAQLLYYVKAPWRMYGLGDQEASLTPQQREVATRERERVTSEIEVLEANADLYEKRAVRNRAIELEGSVASIPKTFLSEREALENEDFYRKFFALSSWAQLNLAYKSYWFEGIMALLFVSVLVQVLRFKLSELLTWQRFGFFVTHIGIMVTLIGGGLSRYANRTSENATRGLMDVTTNAEFSKERRPGIREAESRYYGFYKPQNMHELPFYVRLDAFQREDWPGLLVTYPERTKLSEKDHKVTWIPPTHTVWQGRELEFDYEGSTPNYRLEVSRFLPKVDVRDAFGYLAPHTSKTDAGKDGSRLRPAAEIHRVTTIEGPSDNGPQEVVQQEWTLEPLPEHSPGETQRDAFFLFGPRVRPRQVGGGDQPVQLSEREFVRSFVLRYAFVKNEDEAAALLKPVGDGYGQLHVRVAGRQGMHDEGDDDFERSFTFDHAGQAFSLPGGYRLRVNMIATDVRASREAGAWAMPEPALQVHITSEGGSQTDNRFLVPYADPGSLGQQEKFIFPDVFVRFEWDTWRFPVDDRYVLIQQEGQANPKLYRVDESGPQLLDDAVEPSENLALANTSTRDALRLQATYRAIEKHTRLLPNYLMYLDRSVDEADQLEDEVRERMRRGQHGSIPNVRLTFVDVSFLDDSLIEDAAFDPYALTLADVHERWKGSSAATTETDFAAFLRRQAHHLSVRADTYLQWRKGAMDAKTLVLEAFLADPEFRSRMQMLMQSQGAQAKDMRSVTEEFLHFMSFQERMNQTSEGFDSLKRFGLKAIDLTLAQHLQKIQGKALPDPPTFYADLPMGVVLNVRTPMGDETVSLLAPSRASRSDLSGSDFSDHFIAADWRLLVSFVQQIEKMPRRWQSRISILDKDNPARVLTEGEIRVNEYLEYGGWRFFQSSHDTQDPFYSGIGVVFDPGIPAIELGMAIIILGTIIAFMIKPIVLARRRRREAV